MIVGTDGKKRCFGGQDGKEFYGRYHDTEWGVPNRDDRALFELLVLEGTQAGLSWEQVLKRRKAYCKAFHNFEVAKVAAMSNAELESLLSNRELIRNRLKIFAARQNARVFLTIQKEYGSFAKYAWSFVSDAPIVIRKKRLIDVPCTSKEGDAFSKDLKKRGMTFVGPKIIYSFMQATGMVNDHVQDCWCAALS